jgi:hypothetical protein
MFSRRSRTFSVDHDVSHDERGRRPIGLACGGRWNDWSNRAANLTALPEGAAPLRRSSYSLCFLLLVRLDATAPLVEQVVDVILLFLLLLAPARASSTNLRTGARTWTSPSRSPSVAPFQEGFHCAAASWSYFLVCLAPHHVVRRLLLGAPCGVCLLNDVLVAVAVVNVLLCQEPSESNARGERAVAVVVAQFHLRALGPAPVHDQPLPAGQDGPRQR